MCNMGKFEIRFSRKSREFYFTLVAANGEVIATSEMYQTKAGARKGIRSVRKNAILSTITDTTIY